MQTPNVQWKNGSPFTQPVVAIEIQLGRWITVGGLHTLPSAVDPEKKLAFQQREKKVHDILGKYSLELGCLVYEGDIRQDEEAMQYIDFVFAKVPVPTENRLKSFFKRILDHKGT